MGEITLTNEHLDSYDGQHNYEAGIYEDGEIMGYVQYVLFEKDLTVSDIMVRPNRRREGFGSMLMKYIKRLHPEYHYKPSMKTDLGAKFIHKENTLKLNFKNLIQEYLYEHYRK